MRRNFQFTIRELLLLTLVAALLVGWFVDHIRFESTVSGWKIKADAAQEELTRNRMVSERQAALARAVAEAELRKRSAVQAESP